MASKTTLNAKNLELLGAERLAEGRSKRYRHAARHLATCAERAPRVEDFGAFETHETFHPRLRRDHTRKSGFWDHVQ